MCLLASCHSLSKLNGQYIGDPLEIKMFQGTTWKMEETVLYNDDHMSLLFPKDSVVILKPSTSNFPELETVKWFDFSSKKKRMSVIVKNRNAEVNSLPQHPCIAFVQRNL